METENNPTNRIILFDPNIARKFPEVRITDILTSMPIPGLIHIQPQTFYDERGSFTETFNLRNILYPICSHLGIDIPQFNQDNYSISKRGVVRGIHAENMYKIVRVVNGTALAVFVDTRPDSITFARCCAVLLNPDSGQVFLSPGIGNSFIALTDKMGYLYKVSKEYTELTDKEKTAINPLDPDLNIPWKMILQNVYPTLELILSERDQANALSFQNYTLISRTTGQ